MGTTTTTTTAKRRLCQPHKARGEREYSVRRILLGGSRQYVCQPCAEQAEQADARDRGAGLPVVRAIWQAVGADPRYVGRAGRWVAEQTNVRRAVRAGTVTLADVTADALADAVEELADRLTEAVGGRMALVLLDGATGGPGSVPERRDVQRHAARLAEQAQRDGDRVALADDDGEPRWEDVREGRDSVYASVGHGPDGFTPERLALLTTEQAVGRLLAFDASAGDYVGSLPTGRAAVALRRAAVEYVGTLPATTGRTLARLVGVTDVPAAEQAAAARLRRDVEQARRDARRAVKQEAGRGVRRLTDEGRWLTLPTDRERGARQVLACCAVVLASLDRGAGVAVPAPVAPAPFGPVPVTRLARLPMAHRPDREDFAR